MLGAMIAGCHWRLASVLPRCVQRCNRAVEQGLACPIQTGRTRLDASIRWVAVARAYTIFVAPGAEWKKPSHQQSTMERRRIAEGTLEGARRAINSFLDESSHCSIWVDARDLRCGPHRERLRGRRASARRQTSAADGAAL